MLPTDTNFRGNVFGGAILAELDRVAYVAARRHAGADCVTASFDRVDFLEPVRVGQVVDFDAHLTFAGRSSMEVMVEIRAEEMEGGGRRAVGHAFVTMVAVDPQGRPKAVPRLRAENDDERRRAAEGRQRMDERRRTRAAATPPN